MTDHVRCARCGVLTCDVRRADVLVQRADVLTCDVR
jgi:hypothetical protein